MSKFLQKMNRLEMTYPRDVPLSDDERAELNRLHAKLKDTNWTVRWVRNYKPTDRDMLEMYRAAAGMREVMKRQKQSRA